MVAASDSAATVAAALAADALLGGVDIDIHAARTRRAPPILARQDATTTRLKDLLGAPLLASPWLARLARVSFLGTLDLHPGSRVASSRLDHSLGVAGLGFHVGSRLELSPADLRLLVAACLLHDIGHYPLSHAAEPGFLRALGVAHHGVSEWIVRGNGAIPAAQSLRPALERAGLDPELLWSIIVGDAAPPHAALSTLLLAPINLDTLDGIVRTARSFGRRGLRLPPVLFRRAGDDLTIEPAAIPALDRFWALKDRMYGEVINLPSNIVCEAALSRVVAARFAPEVFAAFVGFDDDALRPLANAVAAEAGLLAGADHQFQFAGRQVARDDLARVRKRYFVDARIEATRGGLRGVEWSRRYRHGRQLVFVTRHQEAVQLPLPGLVSFAGEPTPATWPQLPPGAEGPEI